MFKKVLALVIILTTAVSCASWFTSSQENPDSPVVGGRQDSSDMLFGQAESPAIAQGADSSTTTTARAMESAPAANMSAP